MVERTVAAARSARIAGAAWFFDDSPKAQGEKLPDSEEKEKIFKSLGLDLSMRESFDEVKLLSPEEFVKDYLTGLGCRGIVCGFNFRFGKGRAGDKDVLERLCGEAGILFHAEEPVSVNGTTVSSTSIRAMLTAGDVQGAAEMLGRSYSVCNGRRGVGVVCG